MVEAYWNIGKSIIEEQGGNEKAEYGTGLLKELSKQMTQDFGKGFTVTNLKYMRQFYLMFPNGHALRDELSWTHYRLLIKVENDNAREFYMQEAVKSQWSTRQLERQINSFFYERLLSSKNKEFAFKQAVNNMRCFFKNGYFECENEYRIALRIPEELLLRKECLGDIVKKGQFKRGNILIPYVDYKFRKSSVKRIVINPYIKDKSDIFELGIKELLWMNQLEGKYSS